MLNSNDYPALAEWHRQVRAGTRSPTTFDTLWEAACEEAWAREHCQDGIPENAARSLRKSYDIAAQARRAA